MRNVHSLLIKSWNSRLLAWTPSVPLVTLQFFIDDRYLGEHSRHPSAVRRYLLTFMVWPSTEKSGKPRTTQGDGLASKLAPGTICRVSRRRLLLESMGFSAAVLYVGPALTAPLPEMKEPEIICIQVSKAK